MREFNPHRNPSRELGVYNVCHKQYFQMNFIGRCHYQLLAYKTINNVQLWSNLDLFSFQLCIEQVSDVTYWMKKTGLSL